MRLNVLLLACFAIASVHAEPRCPLPAATCLPAHGHPVLETRIQQLREETQRRLDRLEASTQTLQSDVAKQSAQLGDLSKRVDELSLKLDKLDSKVAAQGSGLKEILLSGLLASLAATLLSSWLLSRSRRTDYTVALLDQFQALAGDRAGVEALIAGSSGANLASPSHQNVLVNVGNWYERFADAYLQDRVDRAALWGLGVVPEANRFLEEITKLAQSQRAANPAVAGSLDDMIAEWKSLASLKAQPQPRNGWWRRILGNA